MKKDTLPTASSTKKLIMWYKVKELKSKNLKNTQISRQLGIHRMTVARYLSMSEAEFMDSSSYNRYYRHKLDEYEDFVVEELRNEAGLSAAQIEDHLKALLGYDGSICSKTVYNFVQHLRKKHGLPKPEAETARVFVKLPETPMGEYAQADFGERWMKKADGTPKKVYFFAMVLSSSRQKYLYFRDQPFNTAWTIYAHEKAFEFYGGKPQKIIYDQDKVLLRRENYGDYIYTSGFRSFVAQEHFECVFCRKSDPQSKGKVENVVKYVKNNFLKGRTYADAETLNRQALEWLARTGNGSLHHGLHRIPADLFEQERELLVPYTGHPAEPREELRQYAVRKDNTVCYKCCFYALPPGTYQGSDTRVCVEEKDGLFLAYSLETGKQIASHPLSPEKGRTVTSESMRRQRGKSVEELEAKVIRHLGDAPEVRAFLAQLQETKQRYYRDALSALVRKAESYSAATMREAISHCMAMNIRQFAMVLDVMEAFRRRKGEQLPREKEAEARSRAGAFNAAELIPQKTDIAAYAAIFN